MSIIILSFGSMPAAVVTGAGMAKGMVLWSACVDHHFQLLCRSSSGHGQRCFDVRCRSVNTASTSAAFCRNAKPFWERALVQRGKCGLVCAKREAQPCVCKEESVACCAKRDVWPGVQRGKRSLVCAKRKVWPGEQREKRGLVCKEGRAA